MRLQLRHKSTCTFKNIKIVFKSVKMKNPKKKICKKTVRKIYGKRNRNFPKMNINMLNLFSQQQKTNIFKMYTF